MGSCTGVPFWIGILLVGSRHQQQPLCGVVGWMMTTTLTVTQQQQRRRRGMMHHSASRTTTTTTTTTTTMTPRRISLEADNNRRRRGRWTSWLRSTPFELDLYGDGDNADDDNDVNPYQSSAIASSSLAVIDADTPLVLGLNKYSHDTALCAAHAETGQVLWALSKERLSRRKHDAGHTADLVETCLRDLKLELNNIQVVVMNNHHHRILPLEQDPAHIEWQAGLRINAGIENGFDEPENLLPDCSIRHELSHHLAHAYSTACQAPFDHGLCVVMDGMGESYRTMQHAIQQGDDSYTSDLSLGYDDIQLVPTNLVTQAAVGPFDWREAESVYVFTKHNATSMEIRPVWKRFTAEHTPPVLYNHGFENMDSVGALYSRASSHIFGDWNACGKVMGLAPWADHIWQIPPSSTSFVGTTVKADLCNGRSIIQGTLHGGNLELDRSLLRGTPLIARNDPDLFTNDGEAKKGGRYDFDDNGSIPTITTSYDELATPAVPSGDDDDNGKRYPTQVALEAIAVAHRIQCDLETVTLDFIRYFQQQTNESNLCLAGGVALNSVLNGRLARELRFQRTFVSPYPGDDGIAVGCCAFALFGLAQRKQQQQQQQQQQPRKQEQGRPRRRPVLWRQPLSPYLGPEYSEYDMKLAMEEAEPWLEIEAIRNDVARLQMMADEIASGGVVAWFTSRSEMGPRALGHRSILADPRKKELVRFINQHVKHRESFRPFAPSVLAEEAVNWFDLGDFVPADGNVSPYMSITAQVRSDKRNRIPAVTHVDGSSRLQTVTKQDNPLYHKLISRFFRLTEVPMVLNTSFNTLSGEPIVETPQDAIRSFLCSMGAIEMLVMGDYVIKRKAPDLNRLLGEVNKDGTLIKTEPACPRRTGIANFQSTFSLEVNSDDQSPHDQPRTTTKVCMPDRPMHHDDGQVWFELMDELEGEILSVCDGTVSVNDIVSYFSATPEDVPIQETDFDQARGLMQNIIHRLVRLYEHTLISW